MRPNLKKCEVVQLNSSEDIRFRNGVVVPPHDEVKYLGCMLNEKGDPQKEVNKRLSETIVTWRRLADFWKHSNCSCKTKLQVYDAVVRTKLMYGLETLQLNESIKKKLDAFQLRGLRQILKLPTTYMDRQYTNEFVYEEANIAACSQPIREPGRGTITKISQYYESQRINTSVDLIKALADDPRKSITIDADTLKLIDLPRWRVGRPRNNRYVCGMPAGGWGDQETIGTYAECKLTGDWSDRSTTPALTIRNWIGETRSIFEP